MAVAPELYLYCFVAAFPNASPRGVAAPDGAPRHAQRQPLPRLPPRASAAQCNACVGCQSQGVVSCVSGPRVRSHPIVAGVANPRARGTIARVPRRGTRASRPRSGSAISVVSASLRLFESFSKRRIGQATAPRRQDNRARPPLKHILCLFFDETQDFRPF